MTREPANHDEVVDATARAEANMRAQTVPVNVYETADAIVVVAPLPAVTADDVTIEFSDNCLRFWAALRSAAPREYLVREWDYGGYEREVLLPEGYGRAVEASLGNGQLAIRVLRGGGANPISVKPTGLG